MKTIDILQNIFGYSKFRPGQQQIIDAILEGERVLAVMPTGAGKSICYQIPALLSDKISVVISPLISLMQDQVEGLNIKHESACFINSSIDYRQINENLKNLRSGKYKILYLSPEKLQSNEFLDQLKSLDPEYLFIDEAHCISEWGHNFRPSYLQIKKVIDDLNIEKVSSFTATATPEVREDIKNQLQLKDVKEFVFGFERDNIFLNVIKTKNKKSKTLSLIKKHNKPTIVYTSTRKNAQKISEFLSMNNIKNTFYHAGVSTEARKMIQSDFLNGELNIICATNAFGMGIDKSNIGLIIHYNMPGTVENYYQEFGRAGRNGDESFAYLLFEERDVQTHKFLIKLNHPDLRDVKLVYKMLSDFAEIPLGGGEGSSVYLNEEFETLCKINGLANPLVYSSISFLENEGILKYSQVDKTSIGFRFLLSTDELKQYFKKIAKNELQDLILFLLREYGSSAFTGFAKINVSAVSKKLDSTQEQILSQLNELNSIGIIKTNVDGNNNEIKFLINRVKPDELNLDVVAITRRWKFSEQKLSSMLEFVHSEQCRFKFILKYFGESKNQYKCGKCDVCTSKLPKNFEYIKEKILETIAQFETGINNSDFEDFLIGNSPNPYFNYEEFGSLHSFSRQEIKDELRNLLDKGKIQKKGNFYFSKGTTTKVIKSGASTSKDYESTLNLFNELKTLRNSAAKKFSQNPQLICSDDILKLISRVRPKTASQLLKIGGFNERMFNKFGNEVLEKINELDSSDLISDEVKKGNLPQESISIYNEIVTGNSLKAIAQKLRIPEALVSMQIESMLKYQTDLPIDYLIDRKVRLKIEEQIKSGISDLKMLKQKLPTEFSYAEIRIVLAKNS
ncbi:MAG: RecQ family ATP-dependent DNA helicase [Melioribacteraceae bacterium]|nr:RecQ family ATP-dependent DNA helicase [Melioribacteraceae bacterium]MCF8431659.1 RecQ family ATP-dependent DNA helicase [Melioribacteraceae bacterium]